MSEHTTLKEAREYRSECCVAEFREIPEVVKKTAPGVTSYYRHECDKCGNPCHVEMFRLWDSDGVEVKAGDILECPSVPFPDHAERWHVAFKRGEFLEVRDLGHNNVRMFDMCDGYYNRGHYSQHMDKLTADDLEYYFDISEGEEK